MKYLKLSLLVPILLALNGFPIIQRSSDVVVGHYYWREQLNSGKDIIIYFRRIDLKPDFTFTYKWLEGHREGITKGIWRESNDTIFLKSNSQPRDIYHQFPDSIEYLVTTFLSNDALSSIIKLIDIDSIPIKYAFCYVWAGSNYLQSQTDSLGILKLNFVSIEDIEVYVLGMKPIFYSTKTNPANNFEFVMLPEKDSYCYFNNKELIIKGDRLYDYSIELINGITTNYYYKMHGISKDNKPSD